MPNLIAGKGGGPSPFVNSFRAPQLNSLRYNTSQFGSPVFIAYGTCRVSVNVIEYWGFAGSSGAGKGGKGLGRSAGKKGSNQHYQVNVAFGLCQGPASFAGAVHGAAGSNRIWSNGGIATGLGTVGLNGFIGNDEQEPDPVFLSGDPNTPVLGYSGTCYVTGTPLQLGSSPVLPNIQFEVTGIEAGSAGPNFPDDARPDRILIDLLTNPRYGAGFPAGNLDSGGALADWGTYCQAAQLAMSLLLDRQQPCARWVEEIAELTVSAVLWSGSLLKIIPYGDSALSANGASWSPNLNWQYNLGDSDFLDFGGGSDPVLLTRADPAEMTNWLGIEYMDSANGFDQQVLPVWDQGLIDQYGIQNGPPVQAHEFTNPTSASISAQLQLQRKAYVRNSYKFRLGWRYSLLEPMDIVLLNDATLGLFGAAVRIVQIEEDENGELTVTAEEIPGVVP
jgi:hypothetical protein